jgi:hypothetical protein
MQVLVKNCELAVGQYLFRSYAQPGAPSAEPRPMKPRTIGSRLLIVTAATALTITMAGSAAAKHGGEGGHGGGWGWHGGEGWHGGGAWHGGAGWHGGVGWHDNGRHLGWYKHGWGGPGWRGPVASAYGWRGPGLVGSGAGWWDWRRTWGWSGFGWGWSPGSWAWGSLLVGASIGVIVAPPVIVVPPPIYVAPPPIVAGLPYIRPPPIVAAPPPVAAPSVPAVAPPPVGPLLGATVQIARAYADNTERLATAFDSLYASLTDTQKQAADTLFRQQAAAASQPRARR